MTPKPRYLKFKDLLFQHGIETNRKNLRLYSELISTGFIYKKELGKPPFFYDQIGFQKVLEYIYECSAGRAGEDVYTAHEIVTIKDQHSPWTSKEIGFLATLGLLKYKATNYSRQHHVKYICYTSYLKLINFYNQQRELFAQYPKQNTLI